MTLPRSIRFAARLGFLAGLLGALFAISGWRLESRTPVGGLDLDVVAAPSGEFGVTPAQSLVRARSLVAGGQPARGALEVVNQTARSLPMRLRAQVEDSDLDDSVHVEVSTGGRRFLTASLGTLRRGSPELWLGPAGRASFAIAVRVPADAPSGYQGRRVTLTLQPTWHGSRA